MDNPYLLSNTYQAVGHRRHWWATSLMVLLGVLLGSTGVNAQSANPPSGLELEDFDFWAEQCQTLAQSRQYEAALAACNEAITLNDNLNETFEVWAIRGEALIYLGQYEDAFVSLGRVLTEQPEDSLVMTYRCMVQYNLAQYEQAVDTCEAALLVDGNWGKRSPALAWYYRGLSLQQQGLLETALDSFGRAIRLSRSPERDVVSQTENETGNQASNSQVVDDLQTWFINNQPGNESDIVEAPLAQAEWCNTLHLLGQAGRAFDSPTLPDCGLEDAIALYEQAILTAAQDPVLWRQQGLALEQLGDYGRALTSYTQALALTPDHGPTLVRQCGVLNQLERYEDALAACELALQTVQPQASYGMAYQLNQHSIALLGLERYDDALSAAKRAIAVAPDYAPAYNSKAVSLWRLDQSFEADRTIQNALRLYGEHEKQFENTFYRPNSEPWPLFYRDYGLAWFNYGRILATEGNPFSHVADYAYCQSLSLPTQKLNYHLRRRSPDSTTPELVSPSCTDISQSDERFVRQLMIRVANGQTQPVLSSHRLLSTLLNLTALHVRGRPQRAFNFASMATELAPESFIAWHNLGLAALQAGRLEEAYYAYSIAHRIEPENIQVLMGVGTVLMQQSATEPDKQEDAIAIYEQVLNIDPTYTPAQEQLTGLTESEQEDDTDGI